MKTQTKKLIVAASGLVLSIASLGLMQARAGVQRAPLANAPQSNQVSSQDRKAQLKAEVAGGLEAAAAINGMYVTTRPHERGAEPVSLTDLVNLSHLVIVGTARSHSMVLSGDGRSVVSEYVVAVHDVFVGKGIPSEVRVAMFGGRVGFSDGSIAQVNTPGFVRPFKDRTYMWFLRRSELSPSNVPANAELGLFELASGPLALYDLTTGVVRVKPSGFHTAFLAKKVWKNRLGPEEFKTEVKRAVAEAAR